MTKGKKKVPGIAEKRLGPTAAAKKTLTVRRFLEIGGRLLNLRVIAGKAGLDNLITTNEWNRPGIAIAGFLDVFSFDRIQVVGNTEISFLRSFTSRERVRRLKRIFRYPIPCFVVTSTYLIPPEFIEAAEANRTPVLKSSLNTSRFVGRLMYLLEQEFAPSMNIHGVLLDVFGMGVLIVGESGVGKSECALELIQRGHRLVADDVVILQRRSKTAIVGVSSPVTKHHMESLFGAGAVCEEKIVDLVIALEQWRQGKEYDRLGIENRTRAIFDVDIPEYVIPVEPGRNLSILVEVAAMNQRLKNTGFNPARTLDEQLVQRMQEVRKNPSEPGRRHAKSNDDR
jgi:HPr kinase/phosphorylase